MIFALLVARAAGQGGPADALQDSAAAAAAAVTRQQRFSELLRTYPDRPPSETFRQVAALVDEGPFEEHDRAEYWIGNARLVSGDRAGARAWFARLWRDHPQSVWTERSWLADQSGYSLASNACNIQFPGRWDGGGG